MPLNLRAGPASVLAGLFVSLLGVTAQAEDWRAVSPQELAMKSEPKAPGAAAIYLYRQVDRSDTDGREVTYAQVKILTEEGRKYADVEISFDRQTEIVRSIEARTIRPDGSVVPFDGKIYEKPIVQASGVKLMAKTFTLPEAEVGSIVEYRYLRQQSDEAYVYNSQWLLSADLFTRQAKFSLQPSEYFPILWNWPHGLPAGTTEVPKKVHDRIRLEIHDVPAVLHEDFMPPEDQMKFRVDFIYVSDFTPDKDPAVSWKKFGKMRFLRVDSFIDKERVMKEAVATIVAPGDDAETKLRKIYQRTQELRNVAFEREKTEQELRREKRRPASSVADVWKQGAGDGIEIAWLFLALVRAAGIEAEPVLVATRDRHFFTPTIVNPTELNSNVVLVTLNGKKLFLDPGIAYTPFGLLPWSETGVQGLKLDKNGGTWVPTPLTQPSDSRLLRKATLKLSEPGTIEGKVTYTFTGLEAQWQRLLERNDDARDRKIFLENLVKGDIPSGSDVTLTNQPEWSRSDTDLVAEFDVRVPGWAASAGARRLFPVGLFSNPEKGSFKSEVREYPLYFTFPSQHQDDVSVELPAGWHIDSLPRARSRDHGQMAYTMYAEDKDGTLHLRRDVVRNMVLLPQSAYGFVRTFFQFVQSGDEEQVVLSHAAPAAPPTPLKH